jgi:hypothetical protein
MKGIDYTASTTAAQAKALKDAGYGFVCRYLVPVRMAWKRLTKSEVGIISAAGLQIVSVYEASANNAAFGATQGIIDGKEAYNEALLIDQPEGSTIYFAVDYDVQAKDYNIIEAYLKAAQAQIIGYNVGCYGSFGVCEEMSKRGIKYCWQTYAWSAGKKSTHANVYQYKNGVNVCGISCDANESFGNERGWSTVPQTIGNGNKLTIGTGLVNTEGLNLRSAPNPNSTILGQYKKGDRLWLYENSNGWFRVYPDKPGWVKDGYVTPVVVLPVPEVVVEVKPMSRFKDFSQVSEYAKSAVLKAETKGLFVGDENGNFNPNEPISRQDFAAVLDKLKQLD